MSGDGSSFLMCSHHDDICDSVVQLRVHHQNQDFSLSISKIG